MRKPHVTEVAARGSRPADADAPNSPVDAPRIDAATHAGPSQHRREERSSGKLADKLPAPRSGSHAAPNRAAHSTRPPPLPHFLPSCNRLMFDIRSRSTRGCNAPHRCPHCFSFHEARAPGLEGVYNAARARRNIRQPCNATRRASLSFRNLPLDTTPRKFQTTGTCDKLNTSDDLLSRKFGSTRSIEARETSDEILIAD
jgi:hypothetical protein